GSLPAAVLAACGAVGAIDPDHDAAAVAAGQGPADRVAISSQGCRRSSCRRRSAVSAPAIAKSRLRSGLLVPVLIVLAAFVGLIGLGSWQLDRKAWKEALIESLEHRLSADPVSIPPRADWLALTAETDEFRRVVLLATFEPQAEA